MHYLALYVLSALVFHQTLRYAQRRGAGVLAVSAVNYVVAAALSVGALAVVSPQDASRPWIAAGLGAAGGVLYFTNLLIVLVAYPLVGVGVTVAFAALGVIVPVLVSWQVWGELMTPVRWGAVALLPAAVLLMRPVKLPQRRMTLADDVLLLAAFLVPGTLGCLHKAVNVYAPGGAHRGLYQAALFVAAAVCSVAYARSRGIRCGRRGVALGSFLGASNVSATLFVLLSLSVMRAVVFYPVGGSLVIALSGVVSWWLWGERLTRRQIAGLGVAVCIVLLGSL